MWCDHSAADRLRAAKPAVARFVRGAGGHLSPELDVPKLMLLKETYGYAAWMERVGLTPELVDFLTLK